MVRTRFAPSPTGYMHIGNLRTALYTYLITRKAGGKFILRIEDTDQERYVEGAVDIIYKSLQQAGMYWDEGPDVGGDYGPYIQSQRRDIYKKYAQELVQKGGAYYCFCDKERLDKVRTVQEASKIVPMYDRRCRALSDSEIKEKLDSGTPYVIRQKMPLTGTTSFNDSVFGKIVVENSTLDDNILLKSDGLPTYNFANVVDDHLMGITHIVRGNEYLSSTPKYNLLYNAFGWEIPEYIHVSPVMRTSTKKLSKRDGDASYQDFIDNGYLNDAIINYVALLGWSPAGENEKFSLDELIAAFDIKGISKSPAIFDETKLAWLNGEYIRDMSINEFYDRAKPYIDEAVKGDFDKKDIAKLLQPRCDKFNDIPPQIDFFDTLPDYDIDLYNHKKMKTDAQNVIPILKQVRTELNNLENWEQEAIHDKLVQMAQTLEVKNGKVMYPLRVAVSGKAFTPGGGVEIAAILGRDESLKRIDIALQKLEN
jgi:glutamyl-tRNA synthetase